MRRRPLVRRTAVLVAAVAAVAVAASSAGCSDDGRGEGTATAPDRSGCPVSPAAVADAVGFTVVVDEGTATDSSCRFVPASAVDDHPGSQVVVVERDLAVGPDDADGYDAVLADVESQVGPADPLDDGEVDGADRGRVATLGRVVQVAAADGDRLVQVTVADGALDAAEARQAALTLAESAL